MESYGAETHKVVVVTHKNEFGTTTKILENYTLAEKYAANKVIDMLDQTFPDNPRLYRDILQAYADGNYTAVVGMYENNTDATITIEKVRVEDYVVTIKIDPDDLKYLQI